MEGKKGFLKGLSGLHDRTSWTDYSNRHAHYSVLYDRTSESRPHEQDADSRREQGCTDPQSMDGGGAGCLATNRKWPICHGGRRRNVRSSAKLRSQNVCSSYLVLSAGQQRHRPPSRAPRALPRSLRWRIRARLSRRRRAAVFRLSGAPSGRRESGCQRS